MREERETLQGEKRALAKIPRLPPSPALDRQWKVSLALLMLYYTLTYIHMHHVQKHLHTYTQVYRNISVDI